MVDVPVPLQLPFVAHSTVAVLGHGGSMPVVVNDRRLEEPLVQLCGYGRRCYHTATSWGLANS